ncbi:WD repeat-containing protein on Y chromosome [Myxocyprinus asiaticus]|uniref:WD repeat-containing protein on Y chromosome n=1 Tax=Myxocyprinus asiaticus TaxID=70543 RepID=UPI00222141B6|nr:WD repeat-containing protein on Y chromosome [Myxocyprinus asiaticus]
MPLGRKHRASSAGAKLETQNKPSILTELGPVNGAAGQNQKRGLGYRQRTAGVSPSGGSILSNTGPTERSPKLPDWLKMELLKQKPRRHSLTLGDSTKLIMRQGYRDPAYTLNELKIEQMLSCENIKQLKLAFDEFAKNGIDKLDYPQFRSVVKKCLGLQEVKDVQIQQLFMKIDYTDDGKIEWHEFCTYMHLEDKKKEETVRRSKMAAFALPANIKALTRGEPILKIHLIPDGTIVTLREDGVVSFWTTKLQLKKTKNVFAERPVGRKSKRATDSVLMPEYNILIIGTGAREIQFYELPSLAPCCQLSSLETVPLNLDCCSTGTHECIILYGDTQGCVNIILMKSVWDTLRLWENLPKVENVPNISIDHAVPKITYIRWKVHQDWVSKVKYFQSIRAIVSTSNHEDSALVIGCILPSTNIEAQMRRLSVLSGEGKSKQVVPNTSTPLQRAAGDQTVFTVCKGVMTFDFCKSHNILVTGGMDRLLRMWNPHVPGWPRGILKGHNASISYLCIASEDGHIFSVSTDNTAKIWHIQDQTCLFTAHPKASQIQGELSACLYYSAVKGLYIATDSLALLSLQTKTQPKGNHIVSHKEPVLCCGYSVEFRQVVSCSLGSVIKVWDIDTGAQVFEFGCAHGESAITCMAFDTSGRRLMTGGRDGCLKMWNFNNGQCVKILSRDGRRAEICDCTYLTLHRNAFLISVGWGRRIDIYLDSPEETQYNQRPKPSWQEDVRNGHKEDILCIAQCAPNLLATGSYDGEIIVWNVVSGCIQCRFQTPQPQSTSTHVWNTSVLSLIFLNTRAIVTELSSSAWLVSSGSQGFVHFWSVLNGGKFITSFQASHLKQQIMKLALTQDDSLLFTADHVGYIDVYNIKQYALQPEQNPPEKVNFWRAHISSITSLKIIENDQLLLTSSMDCSVRLWNVHGDFIGTFGQAEIWSIHTPSSWKHPAVAYEILIDPLSMPSHPILEKEIKVSDVLNSEKMKNINSELDVLSYESDTSSILNDKDIDDETNNWYPSVPGRRQHHSIFEHVKSTNLKDYHSVNDYDIIVPPPTCKRPNLSLQKMDTFKSNSVDD